MKSEFGFIGWCNDAESNHDKIWGYIYRPTPGYGDSNIPYWNQPKRNVCIFWARRGRAMQFKSDVENHELHKLVRSKMNKGYQNISEKRLKEIWPSFDQEMQMKLSFEVLAGNVK